MLVYTGVIFMQLLCGYCYRESTIDRTDERRVPPRELEESMQMERTEKLIQDTVERDEKANDLERKLIEFQQEMALKD